MGAVDLVSSAWRRITSRTYKYAPLPTPATAGAESGRVKERHPSDSIWSGQNRRLLKISMVALALVIIFYFAVSFS
jgi:hypothetical protein